MRRAMTGLWGTAGFVLAMLLLVAAIPKGFLFLKELAGMGDADVKWVCKQNLKKNRLRARFPER